MLKHIAYGGKIMKKKSLKYIVGTLLVAMIGIGMIGCGGNGSADTNNKKLQRKKS